MDNEELAELEPLARLLFVYLWMLADREGRLEDRPKRIAAQALPYDRSADVGAMLDDLHKAGFITRYIASEVACIQILAFHKHQTPHVREADSSLPPPGQGTTLAVPRQYLGSDEALPGSPDSGFSDSGSRIGGRAEQAPLPATKAKRRPAQTQIPDDFGVSERVSKWAAEKGYGNLLEHLEAFKRKVAGNGYTAVSWDDKFMEAIREDWAKLRGGARGSAPPPDAAGRPDNRGREFLRSQDELIAETNTPESRERARQAAEQLRLVAKRLTA